MAPSPRKKVVVLGMMSSMPVAGVAWQTVQYLVGLQRLGYEPFYVEEPARVPTALMESENDDGAAKAAAYIAAVMHQVDLDHNWALRLGNGDARCLGMSAARLDRLFGSATLVINLHGGTAPRPVHSQTGVLVFLETDPVELQIELYKGYAHTVDYLAPHHLFFTYAENYGRPDCLLPVSERFRFLPTRQPIVLDLWQDLAGGAARVFTTIGNWRQRRPPVTLDGETYSWSKHHEFEKFLDLPKHTSQPLELALGRLEEDDRQKLEAAGWCVRDAGPISRDLDLYRMYLAGSRGEFTVAKDQNVRLRTGWFSDRSASYLAAGRPVVTQDTAFDRVFPCGEGLFAFLTMDEVLAALEKINAAYDRHSRAASDIAREYFSYDVVLRQLLSAAGV